MFTDRSDVTECSTALAACTTAKEALLTGIGTAGETIRRQRYVRANGGHEAESDDSEIDELFHEKSPLECVWDFGEPTVAYRGRFANRVKPYVDFYNQNERCVTVRLLYDL